MYYSYVHNFSDFEKHNKWHNRVLHLPKSHHWIFTTQIEYKSGLKLLQYPICFAMKCAIFLNKDYPWGIRKQINCKD